MIDIARNIVPCSDKQDMKSRNGSYFQPSFSTRKRQRISSDLFSELPQKRSKTTNGRIWNKATYSFSSQILCTISSKVIRMWASLRIFVPQNKFMNREMLYNDLSGFLAMHFPCKVQKISINAGFTCPNRDGSVGYGGCTYCNNQTFNPAYCHTGKSVTQQLEEGKRFFVRKYPEMKYLAYFQAYTNTYGELEELKRKYEEALMVEDVVGLVIGTRPDCMPISLLDYLEDLGKRTFVLVEYGIESTDDETLRRINRGHTFAVSAEAVRKTAERGILVGGHIILGLPGEEREMLIRQAGVLSQLPLTTLKLHQLQLIKGTRMASEYVKEPEAFHLYTADEYVDLVIDYIEHLRPDIVLERFVSQSPKELLIAPDWGLKNYEFTDKVKKRMREKDAWQGKYYKY